MYLWLYGFIAFAYKRVSQYKFELYIVFIVNVCRKHFIHMSTIVLEIYLQVHYIFSFLKKTRNKFTEKTPYVALVQEVSSENLELLVKCRNIFILALQPQNTGALSLWFSLKSCTTAGNGKLSEMRPGWEVSRSLP